MNRQEALKALQAAGKGKDADAHIRKQAEDAGRVYDGLRRDTTLSDTGRNQALALAFVQRQRTLDKELASMAAHVATADRDDAERVFGTKGLAGDAASLTISRRDAADRVAAITDRAELRELLRKATRSGDEVLARAIAERAVDDLDDKTMHQFLADRPALDAAGERLWNARRADDTWALTVSVADMRPPELWGMSDTAIEQLANPAPADTSAAGLWGRS